MRHKQTSVKALPATPEKEKPGARQPLIETEPTKIRKISDAEFKELVSQYERLVLSRVRKFFNWGEKHGVTRDDMIQGGGMGLLRAAETYDPEQGASFMTWAVWWIDNRIREAIRKNALVKPTAGKPEPVIVGMDVFAPPKSDAGDVDARLTMAELPLSKGPTLEEELADTELLGNMRNMLDRLDLSKRDRQIFDLRCKELGLEDIGKIVGLSRERVRQILAEIGKKARQYVKRNERCQPPSKPQPVEREDLLIVAAIERKALEHLSQQQKTLTSNSSIDTSKSIYYALKGTIVGKDPKETLDLLMDQDAQAACERIRNALKNKFPEATNAEIAHAITMEINRFQLVTMKGELCWKWEHTRNRTMFFLGKAADMDPPSILRNKAEIILKMES